MTRVRREGSTGASTTGCGSGATGSSTSRTGTSSPSSGSTTSATSSYGGRRGRACLSVEVRIMISRLLEPCLAVGQVLLAWVPDEDRLECGDDPSCISSGAAVIAGNENHAEMAGPARCYRFVVQRAEVAKVIGDDDTVLSTGQRQHFGI